MVPAPPIRLALTNQLSTPSFPQLIPKIAKANDVELISVYEGMGGVADWSTNPKFPKDCKTSNWAVWPPCKYWCDAQSCDQCHPDDAGYEHLAGVVLAGLGLP